MVKTNQVCIEKIGGTSMLLFGKIVDSIILHDEQNVYNRIFVVSAYGGITNDLLEHKKSDNTGIYKIFERQGNYQQALQKLKQKLFKINKGFVEVGLDLTIANEFISTRIDKAIAVLESIEAVLASGYVNRTELLLSTRELLASLGEMHSAFNSANILQYRGYQSNFIDLSGWGDSSQYTIDERIKHAFETVNPSAEICFVTGYTKGTEGIMREFDRGYSEVTFSKIAVALKAKEAVIHKEFHLCSGDPELLGIDAVKPMCNTNFDVADQLADVDMEAIHPKASKVLETAGIPIRVKNAFEPRHQGTLITKDYICPESRIEIITGSKKTTSISIYDTRMVGKIGFDLEIMKVFVKNQVSFICKMTNANTIEIIIKDKNYSKALVKDLKAQFETVTVAPVAIVCAIGSNIAKPGILAMATNALASKGINILAVSQTSRQTNMQFIVFRDAFIEAQKYLHQALCEQKKDSEAN
ncbi:MAG: aspartate kinase [Deltaproteobacteria bacterium]|nr:aspartate kinase [Deltaproteobacteria bacterium]MBT4643184.1 aspartate kinase [Deltaproteobacteria bacterium]MBT7889268.1 aspartate kinase [Deltaproteobacteria bacterium]